MVRIFGADGFWRDWKVVPTDIRETFITFLPRLRSPYDVSLLRNTQTDRRNRYVCEFTKGWVVAWRTEATGAHFVPSDDDSIDVELLVIDRKANDD